MELQRLDEITKDLCKLYGEFCCELAAILCDIDIIGELHKLTGEGSDGQ